MSHQSKILHSLTFLIIVIKTYPLQQRTQKPSSESSQKGSLSQNLVDNIGKVVTFNFQTEELFQVTSSFVVARSINWWQTLSWARPYLPTCANVLM